MKKEKDKIREKMYSLRSNLSSKDYNEKNKHVEENFYSLSLEKEYNNFMSYVNIKKEVRTRLIIDNLIKKNKTVSVPICLQKTTNLIASKINSLDELESSFFNLFEPKKEKIEEISPINLEVIIIPGIAFDRSGNRIGFGKGYYDRFLKKVKPGALKIAMAYDFQVLKDLPTDSFDVNMDMIITDKEIIEIKDNNTYS